MTKPDKKLFLLDAMALIYRAHFAFGKNPIVNSKGMNTGATLGFTNSLLEILNKEKPTHIAVAFDTAAPTFRHESFTEYKAHREAQPEDIQTAIPLVKDIVRAFNIPVLEQDGYEADDIIGTFAKQASKKGFEVFMMTPDKDFAQIVEDHIYLYKPAFMGNGVDVMGVEKVLKKWDIETIDQVRDILGLMGDAVDNIPGIPGIGPKTASKLVRQYGTVENLVANADQLKGKQKENVVAFGAQGILSKELATICVDCPIEFIENDLEYSGPNEEKLRAIFQELEFRTLMKRVFGEQEAPPKTSTKKAHPSQMSMFDQAADEESLPEINTTVSRKNNIHTVVHHYHLIDTPVLRKKLVQYLLAQEEFCFDTETSSLKAHKASLIGLSFSYYPKEAYYVPVPEDADEAKKLLQEFKPVFEKESILKIGQNLKYDLMVLKKYGVSVKGAMFDTMIAHYLIEPDTGHSMDVMANNYLNYKTISIESMIGKTPGKKSKFKQESLRNLPLIQVAEYAGEDADITLQLKHQFAPQIENNGLRKLFFEVEIPLTKVLASMEYEGVKVDIAALADLSYALENDSRKTEREIYEIAGESFNIASPKQLGEVLFDRLKLLDKPKKTRTGQYATGEEILSRLACDHIICSKILDFREYQKLKSTYVDALPALINKKDGRIHTTYGQAVAATGRLSSNNPNLQNIPIRTERGREIRKAFVARDENHLLFSADYSQIELRIMASLSKDESMIAAFNEGRDIHATTASKIYKVSLEEVDATMRRMAKSANFGIIYGISAFGLSQNLSIPRSEAKDFIDAYFEEFPGVKKYMDDSITKARDRGYVETILGRRRYLRDITSRNATIRGYAERNAINAPIQGSAADIIKVAMVQIHEWMEKENLRSKMILQVHDELVFDVHKEELKLVKEKIDYFMRHAIPLEVPMEVESGAGDNWLTAH